MTKKNIIDLPDDFALVLQEIRENGEEDLFNLDESLDVSRSRLSHIVQSLRSKGLVSISRSVWGETQIRLSVKGQKLTNYIWPPIMKHTS